MDINANRRGSKIYALLDFLSNNTKPIIEITEITNMPEIDNKQLKITIFVLRSPDKKDKSSIFMQ